MSPAQPFFMVSEGQPVAVWLHPAAGASRGTGVVMCPAWGREEASSHGPWRQWAQALSDAGYPCLRLDYPGEGDAWGGVEDAAHLERWVQAAIDAVDALLAQGQVRQVCLMGLRWGAVVAWLAAQRHPAVDQVLAVAPVVRGRQYVRELAALQAASTGEDPALAAMGQFQSGGYVLTQAEVAVWSAVDLVGSVQQHGVAGVRRVCVLDRADLPSAGAWGGALEAAGVDVLRHAVDGVADVLAEPHQAHLPVAWPDLSLRWLSAQPNVAPGLDRPHEAPALMQQAMLKAGPGDQVVVQERFVCVPGSFNMGVLSLPAGAADSLSGQAVLLLNAGSIRHVGPSRLWVQMARHWAAAGHLVLRLDLAGLGESDPRPGRPLNQTYPHEAVDDVAAAVAWLRAQPGVERVLAGGLCSGGYHALAAVRLHVPLQGILMINPLVFQGAEGLDLTVQAAGGAGEHKAQSAMASYLKALGSGAKWRKLMRGQVDLRTMWQVIWWRGQAKYRLIARELSRAVGMPMVGDLARVMQDAMDEGIDTHLVFSEGDPGLPLLREELGSSYARLSKRPQWHCQVQPQADHVFTRWSDRSAMLDHVLGILPASRQ